MQTAVHRPGSDPLACTNAIDVNPLSRAGVDRLPTSWGDYDEVELIGEGGMGVVYKARNVPLNRYEAVKVIRTGERATARDRERFQFEAEATAALEHPHIVPVYRVGEVGERPFFAMKWIDGGELTARAASLRTHPREMAVLMAKVCQAVHHAHRQGILHRDLKPSNVLLDAAGEPHVTDFGLAKPVSESGFTISRPGMTATGEPIGTPSYMAPEQARGEKGTTTAADIYGLGAILYELLAGRPPFLGASVVELIKRVVTDPPSSPRLVNPSTDRDLEAICLKCLEKDPADRYPTAATVAEDLDRYVAGKAVSVRPATVRDWLRQVNKRRPESFVGYSWEIKLWFAAIMAASQITIFALILGGASVGWVWTVFALAWLAGAAATHVYMGSKFTRLPETEKHSMMISVGHIIAHVGLCLAYVPFRGPAELALSVYPAQAVVSGLALFVIGTTHWGRFFLLGLAMMLLAPLLVLWPISGPPLYGLSLTACMAYWAYAVKVTFGRDRGGLAQIAH